LTRLDKANVSNEPPVVHKIGTHFDEITYGQLWICGANIGSKV